MMTEFLGYGTTPVSGCAFSPDLSSVPTRPTSLLELGQNYPNPHAGETSVPFILTTTADVRLTILDERGRNVAGVMHKARSPGPQSIKLNLAGLGLPPGEYVYQLEATTKRGVYRQSKRMSTV
ncbi:hypothetical protein [Hymenobacter antarcticus]|uniref:Por secretion system C-terminal sorting domain-containing protein n=1 Tax=Hymenobacter antarcticus TaxID=486270 RepID=A0ABP7PQV3_9BACT